MKKNRHPSTNPSPSVYFDAVVENYHLGERCGGFQIFPLKQYCWAVLEGVSLRKNLWCTSNFFGGLVIGVEVSNASPSDALVLLKHEVVLEFLPIEKVKQGELDPLLLLPHTLGLVELSMGQLDHTGVSQELEENKRKIVGDGEEMKQFVTFPVSNMILIWDLRQNFPCAFEA